MVDGKGMFLIVPFVQIMMHILLILQLLHDHVDLIVYLVDLGLQPMDLQRQRDDHDRANEHGKGLAGLEGDDQPRPNPPWTRRVKANPFLPVCLSATGTFLDTFDVAL